MRIFLRLWILLCLSGAAWATDDVLVPEEGPLIAERSTFMSGFMPLYWDADEGSPDDKLLDNVQLFFQNLLLGALL